ncbi:MAG: hypothetical protein AAGH53_13995 [Pseudomonadota bacterium]
MENNGKIVATANQSIDLKNQFASSASEGFDFSTIHNRANVQNAVANAPEGSVSGLAGAGMADQRGDIDPKTGRPRKDNGFDAATLDLITDMQREWDKRMQDIFDDLDRHVDQLETLNEIRRRIRDGKLDRDDPTTQAMLYSVGLDPSDDLNEIYRQANIQAQGFEAEIQNDIDRANAQIEQGRDDGLDTNAAEDRWSGLQNAAHQALEESQALTQGKEANTLLETTIDPNAAPGF